MPGSEFSQEFITMGVESIAASHNKPVRCINYAICGQVQYNEHMVDGYCSICQKDGTMARHLTWQKLSGVLSSWFWPVMIAIFLLYYWLKP